MSNVNPSCVRAIKVTIKQLKIESEKEPQDNHAIHELYLDLQAICQFGFLEDVENKDFYKKYSDYVKEIALNRVVDDPEHAETWRKLYWDTVKLESYWFFESYLIYMEHKRPYERRFYEPRKKTQHIVVDDLQKLEDSKTIRMYTLSEPARIGKSGMILFFLSWVILRHPHSHNAMGTYSGPAAKHFYDEFLKIVTEDEYCYQELYTYCHPDEKFITDKSAEMMSISFTGTESFPSICFRGIDGSWTGIVDISDDGYLAVDDLIRDREHALSSSRMDKTFFEYTNKMVDRKHQNSKELMIGTLWNVDDPIMRMEKLHKDDENYITRKIPALNENDESNFDYEYNGYSTEYYRKLRDDMIAGGMEADWRAKFQQAPYRREGLLFDYNEIRWFNGVLPSTKNLNYIAVCDVALGGGDSVSMPIGLQDQESREIYIVDWYFSSAGVKETVPGVVAMLIKYGIMEITFEKNASGLLYSQKVQEELKKHNYICACNTKNAPNRMSKKDKIMGCEGEIKSLILFLENVRHTADEIENNQDMLFFNRSPQYTSAINEMTNFVTLGENPHDDAADSIAQLVLKAFNPFGNKSVQLIDRNYIGF